ncbi:hypothetical protein BGZ68_001016 [Mortierella alpina]|nr:hypothetical protein BGZ68_001016 [Mortierella alpina]
MSSKAAKPYWRTYFNGLETRAPFETRGYFSNIAEPFQLNQFEFYEAVKPTLGQRSALDRWWVDMHTRMQTNRDATIRQLGAKLRKQQEEDRGLGLDDKFWKRVEVRQAIEEDQLANLKLTTDAKKDALLLKSHYTGSTPAVEPKEFPSKNIEMLFRASRTLLQENIEDRLALVYLSKIAPLKFMDDEIFPSSIQKAIEQKTAGEIDIVELNPAVKEVLDRLFKKTYTVKEIMDEITLIKHEAITRLKDGSASAAADDVAKSEVAVALEIIHYFALMISHKKIRRGLSETAYVAHWNFVWCMLFGPSLEFDIGELCSKSTKEDMLFNERAYGGVTSSQSGGRKVDVFVRVYDEAMEEMVELGVNEHKPASANEKILDLQLKKLMRINRSILARIPATSPQLFFDVHGMTARLYAMAPVDDIYGCSRSLARVVLPCTEVDMRHFLRGDVFKVLFMYKAKMAAFAQQVLFGRSKDRLATQSPPLTPQDSPAAFTPQKRQPPASPKKKGKRKFQLDDEEP